MRVRLAYLGASLLLRVDATSIQLELLRRNQAPALVLANDELGIKIRLASDGDRGALPLCERCAAPAYLIAASSHETEE